MNWYKTCKLIDRLVRLALLGNEMKLNEIKKWKELHIQLAKDLRINMHNNEEKSINQFLTLSDIVRNFANNVGELPNLIDVLNEWIKLDPLNLPPIISDNKRLVDTIHELINTMDRAPTITEATEELNKKQQAA